MEPVPDCYGDNCAKEELETKIANLECEQGKNEDRAEASARRLVETFFSAEPEKAAQWWSTPNPQLGEVTPQAMIDMGREHKLLSIVVNMICANDPFRHLAVALKECDETIGALKHSLDSRAVITAERDLYVRKLDVAKKALAFAAESMPVIEEYIDDIEAMK